jgi:hypothetical protein
MIDGRKRNRLLCVVKTSRNRVRANGMYCTCFFNVLRSHDSGTATVTASRYRFASGARWEMAAERTNDIRYVLK